VFSLNINLPVRFNKTGQTNRISLFQFNATHVTIEWHNEVYMKRGLSGLFILVFIIIVSFDNGYSKGIVGTKEPLVPPRTIRPCCSFGSRVGIAVIPFVTITEITGVEFIGKHRYLGDKAEGNGIIYTQKGGFIDIAHLRDQADWTAYLYNVILEHKGIQGVEIKLGYEGGTKSLFLNIPVDLSDDNSLVLAARIAYDLSVWHEIATWYGVSSVFFLPERFSSFSIEDDYSNLLGVTLGMESIKSDLPYDEAMTNLINENLIELGRVDSISQTYDAMEKVLNKWFTRDFRFPQANVTLKRQYSTYSYTSPLLVPEVSGTTGDKCVLDLPELTNTKLNIDDLYSLQVKLNGKVYYNHYFIEKQKRVITNRDFLSLVNEINLESDRELSKILSKYNL
jgi:hypothetical protein